MATTISAMVRRRRAACLIIGRESFSYRRHVLWKMILLLGSGYVGNGAGAIRQEIDLCCSPKATIPTVFGLEKEGRRGRTSTRRDEYGLWKGWERRKRRT
jgi:hypothetical protein